MLSIDIQVDEKGKIEKIIVPAETLRSFYARGWTLEEYQAMIACPIEAVTKRPTPVPTIR